MNCSDKAGRSRVKAISECQVRGSEEVHDSVAATILHSWVSNAIFRCKSYNHIFPVKSFENEFCSSHKISSCVISLYGDIIYLSCLKTRALKISSDSSEVFQNSFSIRMVPLRHLDFVHF